jgi:hypothetical protein
MDLQFLLFYQEIPFAATCQIMGTCDCWESDPRQLNRIVSPTLQRGVLPHAPRLRPASVSQQMIGLQVDRDSCRGVDGFTLTKAAGNNRVSVAATEQHGGVRVHRHSQPPDQGTH